MKIKIILPVIIISSILLQSFSNDKKIKLLNTGSVKSIHLVYDEKALRIPGSSFLFGIVVTTHDGRQLSTNGYLNGTLWWLNFKIQTTEASFFLGNMYIPFTTPLSKKTITVKVSLRKNPEIFIIKEIPFNYITGADVYNLNNFQKVPGSKIDLGLNLVYDNGMILTFSKPFEKIARFQYFDILVKGGYYKEGRFFISDNIFEISCHEAGMVVVLSSNPEIKDTFKIKLDYKCSYNHIVSAPDGYDGINGSSGNSGCNGLTSGADGWHGTNGYNGSMGFDGYHGYDLEVVIENYYDSILNSVLLKVKIENLNTGENSFYLVNPLGGKINICTRGGDGGDGGNGGWGGDGGNGAEGEKITEEIIHRVEKTDTAGKKYIEEIKEIVIRYTKGGNGGHGGNGGYGADGADGGDGGNIYLYFTPGAKSFQNCIIAQSEGGLGGFPGSGGKGGNGGQGGKGCPDGFKGSDGSSGSSGYYGFNGSPGQIIVSTFEGKAWND